MRKKIVAALLLPAALMLSSCDLLPEEEPVRTVTTVRSTDRTEYKVVQVVRGDLAMSQRLYCSYMPLRTDALSFAVGGEYVDEIFVQVGDFVKQGQLLAQLEMEDLDSRIAECQRNIDALEMDEGYLFLEEDIAIRRQQILHAGDEEALMEAVSGVQESYDAKRQTIEDSLHLGRMQLAVLQKEQRDRQIRAPYEGTITYLKPVKAGETSRLRDRVITIVDSSMSIFRADTEFWNYMPEGQKFTITANGAEYHATVTAAEALGLPPEEYKEGSYGRVYMKPDDMVFGLKDNDRGAFELVLDSRTDVLIVPNIAVAEIDGQQVVYYVQENGVKGMKPVTTGMRAHSLIEIVEGVEEGEWVIVPY